MKNKRILVIGIALVFMAMVAGVVFAGEMKGVSWYISGNQTYVTNNNDYRVRVHVARVGMDGSISQGLDAGETKTFNGEREIIKVIRVEN